MNWFLRLKLANKLLLTFLMCSALTAAVGAYGMIRVTDLARMLATTYTDSVLPSQLVSEAVGRYGGFTRSYVRLPSIKDPVQAKEDMQRAKDYLSKLDKVLGEYRKTNLSAREHELLQQIDAALPGYIALTDKEADLAMSGKSAEAAELSNGEVRKANYVIEAL